MAQVVKVSLWIERYSGIEYGALWVTALNPRKPKKGE